MMGGRCLMTLPCPWGALRSLHYKQHSWTVRVLVGLRIFVITHTQLHRGTSLGTRGDVGGSWGMWGDVWDHRNENVRYMSVTSTDS